MERYTKILVENYSKHFVDIRKNPLYVKLLIAISFRARRSNDTSLDGLEQGEFFLSEMEYNKFGLEKSQKGQINRAIKKFIKANFIGKVVSKTGSKGGQVYIILDGCPFQPSFQTREQKREETRNGQRTNKEEISKVSKKEIKEMDFDSLVQAYSPNLHDLFVECHGVEEVKKVKDTRFKNLN